MPRVDQLEIITQTGEVYFLNLDPARGITNIGHSPDNDVVIDSPRVADFQAILDHRQRPFSLVTLTEEGEVAVGGNRLTPNTPAIVRSWDTIQMDGVSVVVIEGEEPAIAAAPTAAAGAAATVAEAAAAAKKAATKKATRAPEPVYQITGAPPPDQLDDIILLELPERAYTINVLQTAVWRLTVINAGPLVAEFHVAVEGIEDPWLQILPPKVNLNEGQRTTVTITVTPPRSPTSRAGNHHFAIVVTSPDYAGHKTQLGATVTINPFFDYGVAELSPRQGSTGWFKHSAEYALTIANKGNSLVPYEVTGEDDQKGCSFEFMVPGESVRQARQTVVTIEPDQVLTLPVYVTPLQRKLIGLRKRNFSLTVTTTPQDGEQTARSVLGILNAAPLIGPWLIVLIVVVTALLIALIFRPWIRTFTGIPDRIQAGEPARLSWEGSPFAGFHIDPDVGVVDGPVGSRVITPAVPTTYHLIAENLLTKISDVWFRDSKAVSIDVVPVLPKINTFAADKTEITAGDTATIFWDVTNADDVQLLINNAPETIPPAQYTNRRALKLDTDTTFVMKAQNQYTKGDPVQQNFTIKVNPPTPTPIPTPGIVKFDVNPKIITAGQTIHMEWDVIGVSEVQISNIPGTTTFPPQGTTDLTPQQTTVYVLSAGVAGAKVTRQWQVIVNPAPPTPTPTPIPKAPVIEFFTATPNQVVKGSATTLNLSWSVLSGTTNIEISGPTLPSPLSNLASSGSINLSADAATLFILTAFNGDLKTSTTANISAIDPSPTPTPPPTPTPVPTPFPPPVIQNFYAIPDPSDPTGFTQIISTSFASNVKKYLVRYGDKISLAWITSNTDSVVLEGYGSQPLNNTGFSVPAITGPVVFILDASNQGTQGKQPVRAFVYVDLLPKPVPPPPFNVGLSDQTTQSVKINWDYDVNFQNDIIGFRVYKAPQGSNNFQRIAAETPLTQNGPVLNNFSRSFTDTSAPICGQQYYVVGVYVDNNGHSQETAVGVPTVLTLPCATVSAPTGDWFHYVSWGSGTSDARVARIESLGFSRSTWY